MAKMIKRKQKRRPERDVSDATLKRASIRKWKPMPVEKEKIEKVLEAGERRHGETLNHGVSLSFKIRPG